MNKRKQKRYDGQRALVAEADVGTRKLCADLLEDLGFTVDVVDSGVAALRATRRDRPDVILIDLQMRDVTGIDLIGWLRADANLNAVPIIATSALSVEDGDSRLSAGGGVVVVRKPVSPASVVNAVAVAFIRAGLTPSRLH